MNNAANEIVKQFENLTEGRYAMPVLFTAIAAAAVSGYVPTPASAFAALRTRKYSDEPSAMDDVDKQKFMRIYHQAEPFWWATVFLAVYFKNGTFEEKGKLALQLIGAGAIIGILTNAKLKEAKN